MAVLTLSAKSFRWPGVSDYDCVSSISRSVQVKTCLERSVAFYRSSLTIAQGIKFGQYLYSGLSAVTNATL
jgi:hypothetical protein